MVASFNSTTTFRHLICIIMYNVQFITCIIRVDQNYPNLENKQFLGSALPLYTAIFVSRLVVNATSTEAR